MKIKLLLVITILFTNLYAHDWPEPPVQKSNKKKKVIKYKQKKSLNNKSEIKAKNKNSYGYKKHVGPKYKNRFSVNQ